MSTPVKAPYEAAAVAPSQASWQGLPRRASYTLPVTLTPVPGSFLGTGADLANYVGWLFRDSPRVELRHQAHGRWTTYWFTDADSLLAKAAELADSGNLFATLNRIEDDIGGRAAADADVIRHTRLLFDFDPERPADCASTDDELAAARAAAEHAQHFFRALGWPSPLFAMSGNGFHLQYRVALPNNHTTRDMLRNLYQGLARELSPERVKFDPTVRNPARICALYGSIKRKGVATPERPHRQSWCEPPRDWKQVTVEQVARLASRFEMAARPRQSHQERRSGGRLGAGDYRTLDAVLWFKDQGLYKRPAFGGKHYVTCPWVAEHSSVDHPHKTDTVIWEGGENWPTFHCSHAHCDGRTIRDVMELFGDADGYCTQGFSGRGAKP